MDVFLYDEGIPLTLIFCMDTLYIPVVLGTARRGRNSERPARFIYDELSLRDNIETTFVDVADMPLVPRTVPAWGDEAKEVDNSYWQGVAARADAFIFVLPEYNHGYPGEFKLLLDSLTKEYKHKPVAIAGVAKGIFGGSRMIDHLKPVLSELHMVPIRESLYFTRVNDAFTEDGTLKDPEPQQKYLTGMLEELTAYAHALRQLRSR